MSHLCIYKNNTWNKCNKKLIIYGCGKELQNNKQLLKSEDVAYLVDWNKQETETIDSVQYEVQSPKTILSVANKELYVILISSKKWIQYSFGKQKPT